MPLELAHSGVSKGIPISPIGGAHYLDIFMKDAAAMRSIFLLKNRYKFLNASED